MELISGANGWITMPVGSFTTGAPHVGAVYAVEIRREHGADAAADAPRFYSERAEAEAFAARVLADTVERAECSVPACNQDIVDACLRRDARSVAWVVDGAPAAQWRVTADVRVVRGGE